MSSRQLRSSAYSSSSCKSLTILNHEVKKSNDSRNSKKRQRRFHSPASVSITSSASSLRKRQSLRTYSMRIPKAPRVSSNHKSMTPAQSSVADDRTPNTSNRELQNNLVQRLAFCNKLRSASNSKEMRERLRQTPKELEKLKPNKSFKKFLNASSIESSRCLRSSVQSKTRLTRSCKINSGSSLSDSSKSNYHETKQHIAASKQGKLATLIAVEIITIDANKLNPDPSRLRTAKLFNAAIKNLKKRRDPSVCSTKNHFITNYAVDVKKLIPLMNKSLKSATASGAFAHKKGRGSNSLVQNCVLKRGKFTKGKSLIPAKS